MERRKSSDLPPGFRFHPTDEELIIHYLKNQAKSRQCPVSIIPEVDIYKFNPWELPEKTELGETEWYFFSPRDRKYPNGERPNRATASGYWKATGTDKAIYSGSKHVGVKKALVFYKGRPPKGTKTDWIMHEYRLQESTSSRPMRSMKLDEWVLCRIYKKKHLGRLTEAKQEKSLPTETAIPKEADNAIDQKALLRFPRPCSLAHLLEFEYMANLLIQNPFSSTGEFYNMNGDKENCIQSTEMMKFQGNQDTPFNHENFVKPIFEF